MKNDIKEDKKTLKKRYKQSKKNIKKMLKLHKKIAPCILAEEIKYVTAADNFGVVNRLLYMAKTIKGLKSIRSILSQMLGETISLDASELHENYSYLKCKAVIDGISVESRLFGEQAECKIIYEEKNVKVAVGIDCK